jgi:hypothetical protein
MRMKGQCVLLMLALSWLAAAEDLRSVCAAKPQQHTEVINSHNHEYSIRMGGSIDGEATRDPIGYWAFDQFWEPNVLVRLENIGDAPLVNPWLRRKDQPDTRSLQTIVDSVVTPDMTDRDKARRLWEFEIKNRFHATTNDDEAGDAVKRFNAYGYALCYDESKIISDLWRAAGLKVRRGFPNGHSTAEVFYDGAWHLLDSDEQIIVLLRDNKTIASEAQIVADHDLMKRTHNYGPLHDDDRFRDESGASLHFYEGERSGEQPSLTKHRMDFTLRPGEALTWSWALGNRFHGKDFSCCGAGTKEWNDRWRLIAHVRNGELSYAPDLRNSSTLQYVETSGVELRQNGPFGAGLYLTGRLGSITVPVKSAYPVVGGRLDVDFGRGSLQQDSLKASLSFDDGKSWRVAGVSFDSDYARLYIDLNGLFPAKDDARYGYLLRLDLVSNADQPQVCVKGLNLRSTLQMAELALPGVHLGENSFIYSDQSGSDSKVKITHVWQECGSLEVPGKPEKALYPADGTTADGTLIHFRWQPPSTGPAAADYEFELSEYPDMHSVLSPNFHKLIGRTQNRNTASYELPYRGLLNPGQTYYWHVRARSKEGVWGPWSNVFSFSALAPPVPANINVQLDRAAGTVTLSWEPGEGGTKAARFRIYGSVERGFTASEVAYRYNAGRDGMKNAPPNLLLETKSAVTSVVLPIQLWRPFYRVSGVDVAGRESGSSNLAELTHPLILTRELPDAHAASYYQAKIETSASIGHLVLGASEQDSDQFFRTGDELAFAIAGGPQGLTIDKDTGLLSGFLPANVAGRHEIVLSVSEKRTGVRDSVNLVLQVRDSLGGASGSSR